MHKWLLAGLALLITVTKSAYQPELMLTADSQFLNKLIANYSTNITEAINNYTIPDIPPVQQKVSGVKVSVNLTDIHQAVSIHWGKNLIDVLDKHTLMIKAKHINVTINAYLDAKIGPTRKQSGQLTIQIYQLSANITTFFDSAACPNSLGFNVQIKSVDVGTIDLSIKIKGKFFDNLIIKQVQKLIIPRIPEFLRKAIKNQVNPLLSNLVCNRIEQQVVLNELYYIIIVNTTEVPEFDDSLSYLKFPVDITLQNMLTNQTNDQLQRDDLPGNPLLSKQYQLSLSMSSNFLNTIIWLVGDARLLNIDLTNAMIQKQTPNPPIALNTTNLSILLPALKTKEWANKQVFLLITPSTKFEHLLIRSGRIVTVLCLSVKFVVNIAGNSSDGYECIKQQKCVVACDLNMTLPLSLALGINQTTITGLLHSSSFYSIKVIDSKIQINLDSLKSILNSIVGSLIPSVNSQLASGMDYPQALNNITKEYHITALKVQTFQDYIGVGLNIKV